MTKAAAGANSPCEIAVLRSAEPPALVVRNTVKQRPRTAPYTVPQANPAQIAAHTTDGPISHQIHGSRAVGTSGNPHAAVATAPRVNSAYATAGPRTLWVRAALTTISTVVPTRPVQNTAIHHHCACDSSARAYGILGSQLMTL